MNKDDIVVYKNKIGIIIYESKRCVLNTVSSKLINCSCLNNVLFEDGTVRMCFDEDLELFNEDTNTKLIEQDNQNDRTK